MRRGGLPVLIGIVLAAVIAGAAFGSGGPVMVTYKNEKYKDQGNCPSPWANDTATHVYQVTARKNGTYLLVETFVGTFVTIAGPSPNGCGADKGGRVPGGVKGTYSGRFAGVVSGGTFDPKAKCLDRPCDTADFVHHFFGKGARDSCQTGGSCTISFTYQAAGQGLRLHRLVQTTRSSVGDIAS